MQVVQETAQGSRAAILILSGCGFHATGFGSAKSYKSKAIFLGAGFMKRIFIAIVGIAHLLATGAFAADLAPRTYTKAPVMVDPGYDWTGFYAGLNVGYSWGRSSSTLSFIDGGSGAVLSSTADQVRHEWRHRRRSVGLQLAK